MSMCQYASAYIKISGCSEATQNGILFTYILYTGKCIEPYVITDAIENQNLLLDYIIKFNSIGHTNVL